MKIIRIVAIKREEHCISGDILINGIPETIHTEVSDNFSQYIVTDRIDAYVLGLLMFAMRGGYDFESDMPITDDLKSNLEGHLIPTLAGANQTLHSSRILAPLISPLTRTANVIATGISCGVDSLYTIQQYSQEQTPNCAKLNTLAFFNIGAAMKGSTELRTNLASQRLHLAEQFASEYGYDFLFVESNLHLIIHKYTPYIHPEHHSYLMLYCIYAIQGCIKKYYYSSGYSYKQFAVEDSRSPAKFDLLSFFCCSIGGIKFYSVGGDKTRVEKTRSLLNFEPAQKYLNVCVNKIENDGECFKCIRTQLTLDALGGLDKFERVFDVLLYKQNRFFYLKRLYLDATFRRDPALLELLPYFQNELTVWMKLRFFTSAAWNHLKALVR